MPGITKPVSGEAGIKPDSTQSQALEPYTLYMQKNVQEKLTGGGDTYIVRSNLVKIYLRLCVWGYTCIGTVTEALLKRQFLGAAFPDHTKRALPFCPWYYLLMCLIFPQGT